MRETLDPGTSGGASYRKLIARKVPPSYKWDSVAQREATLDWFNRLLDDPFLTALESVTKPETPKPRPELRIVPRI